MAKITREQPKKEFLPITIVIETEDEAKTLWHRLNNNGDLATYREVHRSWVLDKSFGLWEALDKVYTPYDQNRG